MAKNTDLINMKNSIGVMKRSIYIWLLVVSAFGISCSSDPEISNDMLDSGFIYSIPDSIQKHLVSEYIPIPTELEKNTPVIIAAHGYTATTFEWDELRSFANMKGTFYVSQVLLGGHGRSYEDFKNATWEDWQLSIKVEYKKLSDKGFKNIYLAGSSTGAPLIINLLTTDFFTTLTQPKGIFMIDPIVVSSNKTLTMVGLLGPILGYTTVELASGETGKWYVYRPQESLKQLMTLINTTRLDLQKGIVLRDNLYIKVYKSAIDDVADPVSALMIYKGLKYDWILYKNIDVEMVDSKLHVFTRLAGREGVTAADITLQQKVFADMEQKMIK